MKELLLYVAKNLVDHPDAVSVTQTEKRGTEPCWSSGLPLRIWGRSLAGKAESPRNRTIVKTVAQRNGENYGGHCRLKQTGYGLLYRSPYPLFLCFDCPGALWQGLPKDLSQGFAPDVCGSRPLRRHNGRLPGRSGSRGRQKRPGQWLKILGQLHEAKRVGSEPSGRFAPAGIRPAASLGMRLGRIAEPTGYQGLKFLQLGGQGGCGFVR